MRPKETIGNLEARAVTDHLSRLPKQENHITSHLVWESELRLHTPTVHQPHIKMIASEQFSPDSVILVPLSILLQVAVPENKQPDPVFSACVDPKLLIRLI